MKRFFLFTPLFILLNLFISWNSISSWGALDLFRIFIPAVIFGVIVSVLSSRGDSSP
ncbi:hypothetical protein ACP26L_06825 [Paenibacillus sp. S-38]|uniref:hypothetical protein n=1 Tax=Paenibacillus sp. S-38 TaxID=3416710 RepID=UPI003CFA966C